MSVPTRRDNSAKYKINENDWPLFAGWSGNKMYGMEVFEQLACECAYELFYAVLFCVLRASDFGT